MSLAAGRLRHRVRIEQRVTAQDPVTGEQTLTWGTVADKVPVAIEPLSVREFIAAQKEDSQLSARIVMRNRPALNASMRMIGECRFHLDRVFNPAGFLADPDSGIEYLTVPVTEEIGRAHV